MKSWQCPPHFTAMANRSQSTESGTASVRGESTSLKRPTPVLTPSFFSTAIKVQTISLWETILSQTLTAHRNGASSVCIAPQLCAQSISKLVNDPDCSKTATFAPSRDAASAADVPDTPAPMITTSKSLASTISVMGSGDISHEYFSATVVSPVSERSLEADAAGTQPARQAKAAPAVPKAA